MVTEEKIDRRTCKECGEDKSLTEFPTVKGRSGKIFHRRVCKTCRHAYVRNWRNTHQDHLREHKRQYYLRNRGAFLVRAKAWQLENRERKLEYQRAWYLANREERLTKQREWYENNKELARAYAKANHEKIAARMKTWRARNADVVTQYQAEWRAANADKIREYATLYRQQRPEVKRVSEAKRRATVRGSEHHFNFDDVEVLYVSQLGECTYCGTDLSDDYEVDHIVPLSRGGSNGPENIQLLCRHCNRMKHNKTHDEFIAWLGNKGRWSSAT